MLARAALDASQYLLIYLRSTPKRWREDNWPLRARLAYNCRDLERSLQYPSAVSLEEQSYAYGNPSKTELSPVIHSQC